MEVKFDHSQNTNTLDGARAGFSSLFAQAKPASVLDVGCGIGAWLKAATEAGVADVFGVDGVAVPSHELLVPSAKFRQQDLTTAWNLGRKFDVVLCLEVGEHLEEKFGSLLVETRWPDDFYDKLTALVAGGGARIREVYSEDDNIEAVFKYLVSR